MKQFPLKYCSKKYQKLIENFKEKGLKLLERQAQNPQYDISQKRWLDLIAWSQLYKKSDKQMENLPKYIIPIHFDNKGLEFIYLNPILHKNNIIKCL